MTNQVELNHKQQQIVSLVSAGLSQSQIAAATGWSNSYITALLKDDDVKQAIEVDKARTAAQDILIQKKYDRLESKLLSGIEQQAATAEMRDLVKALEVVSKNNPKARGQMAKAISESGSGANIVQVNLPPFIQETLDVKVNARNEIVQIGEQAMQSLTPDQFQARIDGIEEN